MTILFESDWNKYPRAIVDTQTQNKSFIEKAYMLKHMGIKNNKFMLALHNPDLLGIDPHSESLTMREMAMIAIECRQNFWYTVRSVWRAPAKAGSNPNQIECNRANLSLWWSFFNHITYILTQPRQTGKSFSTDLLSDSLMNFMCENTQINLLTKDDTLRTENIKRLKEILDELPPYLDMRTKDDANNTEQITVKNRGNTYLTHVAQASPKKAANTARGQTSPIFHIDESPFQTNIEIAMPSALAAMGAVVEAAKANQEPYGVILTTTAGKKDEKSGRYVYNYLNEAALWTEHFYDAANAEELERMVRKNSRGNVFRIYGAFNHRQLGKDDTWLKEQLERTNQTPEEANRDYFNRWTSGSLSSPLPVHILEVLTNGIKAELYQQIWPNGSYVMRWYIDQIVVESYMATSSTIMSIDTSDASGGDAISLIITDVETGGVMAAGTFNETNLIMFAQWLVVLLVKYKNSSMIIERRSSAITIIDYLLMFLPQNGIDPFERLFNWVINDPLEHKALYDEVRLPMRRRSEDLYVRAKKYFGFATSGSGQTSRSELYSNTLMNVCKRCGDKLKDRALTEQITGLVIKNGRVDHPEGGHDDLVIGLLLGHWMLTMAKNLHNYGIDATRILLEHKPKVEVKPENVFVHNEQMKIRARIQVVFDQMSTESDQFVLDRLENEMRFLDSRLVLEDGEMFSVDSVLNQIKQKKKSEKKQAVNNLSRQYSY